MESTPTISRFVLWFFRGIVHRYFRRHFTAVRITRSSDLSSFSSSSPDRLIVFANHVSWWDPMLCVLLAEKLLPTRRNFAPMEANALNRYRIFTRLGVFGVEMNNARGAASFLRTSLRVLAARGVLWVTPQGRFADARERPLTFKPGLAALAARVPGGCVLQPLATEYSFWNQRLPETLLHFGPPLRIEGGTAEEIELLCKSALLNAMEDLRTQAMARDPEAFTVLFQGSSGTGGFYSLGERLRALLTRRPFTPEHRAASTPAIPIHQQKHP